jgi:uncharacterized protein (AIM24 family)
MSIRLDALAEVKITEDATTRYQRFSASGKLITLQSIQTVELATGGGTVSVSVSDTTIDARYLFLKSDQDIYLGRQFTNLTTLGFLVDANGGVLMCLNGTGKIAVENNGTVGTATVTIAVYSAEDE